MCYNKYMSSDFTAPRKRGRPATGQDPHVSIRLPAALIDALDGYRAQLTAARYSRSELIRKVLEDRLIHEGFIEPLPGVGVEEPADEDKQPEDTDAKARAMAEKKVDRALDAVNASDSEKAHRRDRLTKPPRRLAKPKG